MTTAYPLALAYSPGHYPDTDSRSHRRRRRAFVPGSQLAPETAGPSIYEADPVYRAPSPLGVVIRAQKQQPTATYYGGSGMGSRQQINPWAVCTASVGRQDRAKYERCVMSVKRRQEMNGMGCCGQKMGCGGPGRCGCPGCRPAMQMGASAPPPVTMGMQFGPYVPTWTVAAVGALGILGAMVAKTEQGKLLSLAVGIGGAIGAVGYNTLRQQREIDAIVAEGGIYGAAS